MPSTVNKPLDPRIKRTLLVIRDALISLMDEKGFAPISVRDLTARAQINRATFYLHYQDKYDLLDKVVSEMLQEFHTTIQLPPAFEAEDFCMDSDIPPHSFILQLEHIAANASFYKVMLGVNGLPGFAGRMEQAISTALYHRSALAQPRDEQLKVPREMIIRYTTSAHLGIIMQWLENDLIYTPKYMAKQLKRLHLLGPTNLYS
ncbi:TetR/AcrR family transcriptional regulator [Paenibacillus sp. 481]|uniref:TetR/AcrR family transcriptional regulator n=1 Tax=Paenibacillus sp. 481 TaxID=2835869 RepID=UPI001E478123|nr:TetR/AcrR family transcriptional regulator [Paenibacillus sp. 481]UHA72485.1 TetR/AcrR family transcriptional regulator [Paenibacillus sp. 481]